jgi:hypothetical protein
MLSPDALIPPQREIERQLSAMQAFALYDPGSGRIRVVYTGRAEEVGLQLQANEGWAECDRTVRTDTHWHDGTAIVPRPVLKFDCTEIVANGSDRAILALREPFRVTVDGVAFEVDDADGDGVYALVLVSTMPASYAVAIDHWPFLPFTAEITAV